MGDHSSEDEKMEVQEIEDPDAGLSFEEREKIVGFPTSPSVKLWGVLGAPKPLSTLVDNSY